jgi:hypothetical protein
MNAADKALARAVELYYMDSTDEVETELSDLVPILVEAGYAAQEPWGDDPDWFLWHFTDAGNKRSDELGLDPADA